MRHRDLRLLVLAVLVACGVACSAPREEPAPPAAGQEASPPNPSGSGEALMALLPADAAVTGWARKEAPRLYGADGLWDFIDGGAEAYLACGFQEVATSEYANPAMPSGILVDIYRMSDAAGALGIYSQERSPTGDSQPIGAEGYLAGTALNFWVNTYYVKLTAFEEREEIKTAMAQLAEAVSGRIGPAGPRPATSPWKGCGMGGTPR